MMAKCEHCGDCCLSGIPCIFGQILFDITSENPTVCPACQYEDNKYWCGLIKEPEKWFVGMVGDIKWKCEAMADIARIYIGIGDGCCNNPTMKEIGVKMATKFRPMIL